MILIRAYPRLQIGVQYLSFFLFAETTPPFFHQVYQDCEWFAESTEKER